MSTANESLLTRLLEAKRAADAAGLTDSGAAVEAAAALIGAIHRVLDGWEFDAGTASDIAQLLEAAGMPVREPDQLDEPEPEPEAQAWPEMLL